MEYRILRRVRLGPAPQPTGATRHYMGGVELPPPHKLEIAQYPGDAGYYLFYLDEWGECQTDTYHDTLEDALQQAWREFRVRPDEWESIADPDLSAKETR